MVNNHAVVVFGFLVSTVNALIVDSWLPKPAIRLVTLSAMSPREIEIRRKIRQLKKQELKSDEKIDYTSKIRQKLGKQKSEMLGYGSGETTTGTTEAVVIENSGFLSPRPPTTSTDDEPSSKKLLPGEVAGNSAPELSDSELVELVVETMQEQRVRKRPKDAGRLDQEVMVQEIAQIDEAKSSKKMTSGIGGSWEPKTKQKAQEDMYQPKLGSWGAFPRPRDISKAYGGGRRVGPGFSDETAKTTSVEETRARLQRYREKVGIEVESEKTHKEEIEEALNIGTLAMQRGMYSTAVSALEKVTKYCSSNSKVGGKVFIELGMAYEAAGRTSEAITIYKSLSNSRIDQTKNDAKRLLYGIEAIQFMRDNVNDSAFSRKRASSVFIDTTGLANIASKFDDVYETAYVDLSQSFYKKLTESVVRSSREARQILLQARGPGEVDRLRIVQALRSLSRTFSDALQKEIDAAVVKEPSAFIDGKPIIVSSSSSSLTAKSPVDSMEDFLLMGSKQMLENLDGEWRLQLIADKRGDGVKFFNTTLAWQVFDTKSMTFMAVAPQGFLSVEQSGRLKFDGERRILRRKDMKSSGGLALIELFGPNLGALGSIRSERQLILVDSSMMITRGVPDRKIASIDENEKDYFAVWRRVDRGSFSLPLP